MLILLKILLQKQKKEDEENQDSILMDDLIAEEIESTAFGEDLTYKDMSLEELNNLLDEAVNNEDYELAAKIRDEISKR